MTRKDAEAYRSSIEDAAALQSDEKALENIYLYPKWEADIDVALGDRYRDEDTLYKCIQAHTTQESWPPHLTPALWSVVSLDEWPEWVQPLGSEDAYHQGDKVSHNDIHWISTTDGNVWEPGIYGWEQA